MANLYHGENKGVIKKGQVLLLEKSDSTNCGLPLGESSYRVRTPGNLLLYRKHSPGDSLTLKQGFREMSDSRERLPGEVSLSG